MSHDDLFYEYLKDLGKRMDRLEHRQDKLEEKLEITRQELNERIDNLEDEIERLADKIDSLKNLRESYLISHDACIAFSCIIIAAGTLYALIFK